MVYFVQDGKRFVINKKDLIRFTHWEEEGTVLK